MNYNRNIEGCVDSISCGITYLVEVHNSHKDALRSISQRDYAPGNKSIGGKLIITTKIIDSDEWTRLGLRICKVL